jgi:alpha-L-fucosidase
MNRNPLRTALAAALLLAVLAGAGLYAQLETPAQHDARMQWWREARFGLFIHWGLYAVPAGEWNGKTIYGEWIRNNAHIPLAVYDKLVDKFNPVKFNADAWVRMAKDAGMKYIVITSKHHDGFALFDSKVSGFDVMATPFKRDILKELAEACRKADGIRLCFYHSIMDWHHPDYLPRRDWETDRPAAGANFERYIRYLKAQLKELITSYGPIGVLWFDGEWENTWTEAYGRDLYRYVRSLQPDIIINNRVGASRSGMEGFSQDKESAGDFGTPEQTIPATGLPGLDWETCMTMNDNWGYNSHDKNFKSAQSLLRMLADVASKGGNYLLNVGPTAEGVFPPESVERLKAIGAWTAANGESIYATQASPFKALPWGRCTRKAIAGGARLYLHVFDWPADSKLIVPGLSNQPQKAFLLADPRQASLKVARKEDSLVVSIPAACPDPNDAVVVLDVAGPLDVNDPPEIKADADIFLDSLDVALSSVRPDVEIRCTLDGSAPTIASPLAKVPVKLTASAVVSARAFRRGQPVSGVASAAFTKVTARPADKAAPGKPGLACAYFEGEWDRLPDFAALKPLKSGTSANFDLASKHRKENYAFEYKGFVRVFKDGVYAFFTESDDGSALYIGDTRVVDNDGPHGMAEKKGLIALAAGWHPIRVVYFNATGSEGLKVSWQGAGLAKQPIPDSALAR